MLISEEQTQQILDIQNKLYEDLPYDSIQNTIISSCFSQYLLEHPEQILLFKGIVLGEDIPTPPES